MAASRRSGYPEGAECENAMFLRALLKLGFSKQESVHDVCMAFLKFIRGREGMHCMHHKHLKGKPCVWVQIKDLMMLNEFPEEWRNDDYRQVFDNVQKSLLARNLSEGDFGRHWLRFGHFRSHHSSVFEGVEALTVSVVTDHPELEKAMLVIGKRCVDCATWKAEHTQSNWPMLLERRQSSPWLSLRGLRVVKSLSRQSF